MSKISPLAFIDPEAKTVRTAKSARFVSLTKTWK